MLLPDLEGCVDSWKDSYDGDDDPETYFDDLRRALKDFKKEFDGNEQLCELIDVAIDDIDHAITGMRPDYSARSSDEHIFDKASERDPFVPSRSIFDDVDD